MSTGESGDAAAETKALTTSRAFWGTWSPVLAMVLGATGAGEAVFGQVELLIEGCLTAFGAGMWLWHHFRPDPRVPAVGGGGV